MSTISLYVDNDMMVEVAGLTNYAGDYINTATVTATLLNKETRVAITGMT